MLRRTFLKASGAVFSIGAIDFGLFLLVYCIGHIGYLLLFSTWMVVSMFLAVTLCDLAAYLLETRARPCWSGSFLRYLVSIPITMAFMIALGDLTGIPLPHSMVLGALIPVQTAVGRYTTVHIKRDLGIIRDRMVPGRGRAINSSAAFLFTAPIVFHYVRYFLTCKGLSTFGTHCARSHTWRSYDRSCDCSLVCM